MAELSSWIAGLWIVDAGWIISILGGKPIGSSKGTEKGVEGPVLLYDDHDMLDYCLGMGQLLVHLDRGRAGLKFSTGWKVEITGIKDQQYTIVPKIDGQLNFFFFELLADIKNGSGNIVGYCFVELLPGVYNTKNTVGALFSRVK